MACNVQPQVCKLLQSKLKCNILQQAVVLLVCKTLVFELASSSGNLIAKVMLLIFGIIRW